MAARKKIATKKPVDPRSQAAAQARVGSGAEAVPTQSGSAARVELDEAADAKIAKIINPQEVVELLSGGTVVVKPWSFTKTSEMVFHLEKIFACFMQVKEGHGSDDIDDLARTLIADALPSTMVLVRESVRLSEEEFDNLDIAMEDALDLAKAMVTTCLIRSDGGGLLPKVAALMNLATGLFSADN